MDPRYNEVTRALIDLFDGLHHSDSQRLARIFHPQAHYMCATEGRLQHLTMNEYFAIVDERPSPASRRETRHDRIVSIEFAGPVTARVCLQCSMGPKFFIDFLTLVFLEERWQIVSKVFHFDLQEHPKHDSGTQFEQAVAKAQAI